MGGSASGEFRTNDSSEDSVSHFDREGHYKTQMQQDERRLRRASEGTVKYKGEGGTLMNFVFVSGVLAIACLLPTFFYRRERNRQDRGEI